MSKHHELKASASRICKNFGAEIQNRSVIPENPFAHQIRAFAPVGIIIKLKITMTLEKRDGWKIY